MKVTRRVGVTVAVALVASLTLSGPPASADHGLGGADCPTGVTLALVILHGDTAIGVVEGTAPTIVYGDPIIVGGYLEGEAGADIDDEPVTAKATDLGTGTVHSYPMTTDADGSFEDGVFPFASANWVANWTGTGTCDTLAYGSATILLPVRAAISIVRSHIRPPAGFTFMIRGAVAPNHSGKFVTLQWKRVGTTTIRSATLTLDSLSRYFKRFVSNTQGTLWDFRAVYGQQDAEHKWNRTPWVRVAIT